MSPSFLVTPRQQVELVFYRLAAVKRGLAAMSLHDEQTLPVFVFPSGRMVPLTVPSIRFFAKIIVATS